MNPVHHICSVAGVLAGLAAALLTLAATAATAAGLRWSIEHDCDSGIYQIEVRLTRGPLRPPLRMRLDVDRWSSLPARTALELIPCERVRPTATYFRAGHLLLDCLTRSLPPHMPAQHPAAAPHA